VASGGTQFGPLYVEPSGMLEVPFAGKIAVKGMTLEELASAIKKRVGAISFNPEVVVTYQTELSSTISVSGDVKTPGRYSLLAGIRTALDAVDQAGGTTKLPYQVDLVLRRGGESSRVSLYDAMNGGDFSLQRDDDLVLQDAPRLFTGLGAVTKSGQYPLPRPETSLIDALGLLGGLIDLQADRTGIILFRATDPAQAPANGTAPAKPTFFTLDFSKPLAIYVAQKFRVEPGDVIYVTNAPTVDLNKFLITLIRTVGIIRLAIPHDAATAVLQAN
jgi:polysaccharide biosynthesis/export protein